MTLRVVLVDNHVSILDILQTLRRGADDVTVVARCEPGSGEWSSEVLATILDRQTNAILLDLRVPVMDRLAVLRAMDEQLNGRVVIVAGNVDESAILESIRPSAEAALIAETVPRQRPSPEAGVAPRDAEGDRGLRKPEDRTNSTTSLTGRELEIVRAVASGLRNKVIAEKLRVTEGTVEVHLHNIYKKLALDSRLSLMVYSKEHRLA